MNQIEYIPIQHNDHYTTKLSYHKCSGKPSASILILHGMAEHQLRYHPFIQYLNDHGYDVYIYDHRGHGLDKLLHELGYFASKYGDRLVVEDAITICKYIAQNNRCSRFFLFGHSMGSVIARNIIQTYDSFTGVILCGTTHPSRLSLYPGLFTASLIKRLKGPKHPSPFMSALLFGRKNYTRLTTRTIYDWLSRSHAIVGAYINDPYCGFFCTTSFYRDLISLSARAAKKKYILGIRKDLPLFIISGERDPVGGYGTEVKKMAAAYKKHGLSNITLKLYPECRHELLNELNKEEVYEDINQWISNKKNPRSK